MDGHHRIDWSLPERWCKDDTRLTSTVVDRKTIIRIRMDSKLRRTAYLFTLFNLLYFLLPHVWWNETMYFGVHTTVFGEVSPCISHWLMPMAAGNILTVGYRSLPCVQQQQQQQHIGLGYVIIFTPISASATKLYDGVGTSTFHRLWHSGALDLIAAPWPIGHVFQLHIHWLKTSEN